MEQFICDDFAKCPECASEYFMLYTKLPSEKALKALEPKDRGIILHPTDVNTGHPAVVLICEKGHKIEYKEEINEYRLITK